MSDHSRSGRYRVSLHGLAFAVFALGASHWHPLPALGHEPPAVSGELISVGSVRVLRVWGTPRERGHAHGYLLAEDIVRLLDGYLKEAEVTGGVEAYQRRLPHLGRTFVVQPRYEEELRGVAEGIAAHLGPKAIVPSLGRAIGYEDILAINCIPDSARMGCSSFAAWGPLTKDGGTISGRNLDWHRIAALRGTEVVIANTSEPASGAIGWVSITWPGFIGCSTGMNATGVTLAIHDVQDGSRSTNSTITPRCLILREAIETCKPPYVVSDVESAIRRRTFLVSTNVLIAGTSAVDIEPVCSVAECDGNRADGDGLTDRQERPETRKKDVQLKRFSICTNHFRKRAAPLPCSRYEKIRNWLNVMSDTEKRITLPDAWLILRFVACRGADDPLETYQSVVFEPNHRRMHVAFSAEGKPAADRPPVTLDVARLLRRGE